MGTLCRPEPLDSPLEMGAPVQEGTFASATLVVRSKYLHSLRPGRLSGALALSLACQELKFQGSGEPADPPGQQ